MMSPEMIGGAVQMVIYFFTFLAAVFGAVFCARV